MLNAKIKSAREIEQEKRDAAIAARKERRSKFVANIASRCKAYGWSAVVDHFSFVMSNKDGKVVRVSYEVEDSHGFKSVENNVIKIGSYGNARRLGGGKNGVNLVKAAETFCDMAAAELIAEERRYEAAARANISKGIVNELVADGTIERWSSTVKETPYSGVDVKLFVNNADDARKLIALAKELGIKVS
jgi:hypothetical protein